MSDLAIVGIVIGVLVIFMLAESMLGTRGALVAASVVGTGLGGAEAGAIGVVVGIIALTVGGVLAALGAALVEPNFASDVRPPPPPSPAPPPWPMAPPPWPVDPPLAPRAPREHPRAWLPAPAPRAAYQQAATEPGVPSAVTHGGLGAARPATNPYAAYERDPRQARICEGLPLPVYWKNSHAPSTQRPTVAGFRRARRG